MTIHIDEKSSPYKHSLICSSYSYDNTKPIRLIDIFEEPFKLASSIVDMWFRVVCSLDDSMLFSKLASFTLAGKRFVIFETTFT